MAGSTFELSRLLTGEIALGYTQPDLSKIRGCETINGLIGNASLIWTASALTTVKLTGGVDGWRIHGARRVRRALPRCRACRSIMRSAAG